MANKWILRKPDVAFTLTDFKHLRKVSQSQSVSVNGPLACVPSLEDWVSLVFEFPALFPVSAAQSNLGCYLLLAAKGEKET